MRKFQRAAVVAAAVAGLSVLGIGVSFAGGEEEPSQLTAVANSQANAVATWGGYYSTPHYGAEKAAEAPKEAAPAAAPAAAPEEGYGQYSDGSK
ncbi:hypothetical protein AQI88_25150 [Streptomyces cellostaticus]|uniref:Uncharacterized protein n=1 Tax=Streptomyces cellostaticus TaxID=67285 RepID=A0A101NI39_9ACTN|nr:hypothetical protein [Streptomyces cellostaticus]KUM93701.1 hypothetical protein AQI88_25150 [Streptomyces cellostaticus]GHI07603.1 hypothetical protein Scel_59240 [Streptomyces cellostaticus]